MSTEVFGVIAPHPPIMVDAVGGSRSRVTSASRQALAHARKLLDQFNPDTIVIMSPHSPAASDAFAVETAEHLQGTFAEFGAASTGLQFEGDPEFATLLLSRLKDRGIPAIDRGAVPSMHSGMLDHGVLVPMSFLDPEGTHRLLSLSVSYLPLQTHRKVGQEVAAVASILGRRVAFVGSGDCSHRLTRDAPSGFNVRGAEYDALLTEIIAQGDLSALLDIDEDLIEAAGECGLRSFTALGGFTGDTPTEILSYEGPWGVGYLTAVVGYGATPRKGVKNGVAGSTEHTLVSLARKAVNSYVTDGVVIDAPELSESELPSQAGTFVSLHRNGELRGCIGTILPTRDSLAEEIIRNAIEAAVNDPRFDALTTTELSDLDIKVDVLHAPEPATQEDLNPSNYGVIVTSGWRRGLLLPDLEGVDTVEMQIDIAMRKAGIRPGEQVELERFRVERYV